LKTEKRVFVKRRVFFYILTLLVFRFIISSFATSVWHHTELSHSRLTMHHIQRQRKEAPKSTREHIVDTLFSADLHLERF